MKRLSILSALFLAACGGGSSTGPVDHATAQDGCQTSCEHDHMCDANVDVASCTASCVADVEGVFREDVFNDVVACIDGLACTAEDSSCLAESCTPTSAHESYEARCRDALTTCGASPSDLDQACETTPTGSSDVGFLCVLTPDVMDELTACFDEPCTTIQDCEQQVLADHGIDL